MRRTLHVGATVLVAALAVAASPATATHGTGDFVYTGHAVAPNPTTVIVPGVTELVGSALCADTGLPGVDGEWVDLPTGSEGHPFSVVATSDLDDFDIYFYDAGCGYLGGSAVGGNEAGLVAVGAEWAAVDLFLGAAAEFTLTVEGVF